MWRDRSGFQRWVLKCGHLHSSGKNKMIKKQRQLFTDIVKYNRLNAGADLHGVAAKFCEPEPEPEEKQELIDVKVIVAEDFQQENFTQSVTKAMKEGKHANVTIPPGHHGVESKVSPPKNSGVDDKVNGFVPLLSEYMRKAMDELTNGLHWYVMYTIIHSRYTAKDLVSDPICFSYDNEMVAVKGGFRQVLAPQKLYINVEKVEKMRDDMVEFDSHQSTFEFRQLLHHIDSLSKDHIEEYYWDEKNEKTPLRKFGEFSLCVREICKTSLWLAHDMKFVPESKDEFMEDDYTKVSEREYVKIVFLMQRVKVFCDCIMLRLEPALTISKKTGKVIFEVLEAAIWHFKSVLSVLTLMESLYGDRNQEKKFSILNLDITNSQVLLYAMGASETHLDSNIFAKRVKRFKVKKLPSQNFLEKRSDFFVDPIHITHWDILNRALDFTHFAVRQAVVKVFQSDQSDRAKEFIKKFREYEYNEIQKDETKGYFRMKNEKTTWERMMAQAGSDEISFVCCVPHLADMRFLATLLKYFECHDYQKVIDIRDKSRHSFNLVGLGVRMNEVKSDVEDLKKLIYDTFERLGVARQELDNFYGTKALDTLILSLKDYELSRKTFNTRMKNFKDHDLQALNVVNGIASTLCHTRNDDKMEIDKICEEEMNAVNAVKLTKFFQCSLSQGSTDDQKRTEYLNCAPWADVCSLDFFLVTGQLAVEKGGVNPSLISGDLSFEILSRPQVLIDDIRVAVTMWFDDENQAIERFGRIEEWDVSNISDMSALFRGRGKFNRDLSNWNVGNVKVMTDMFREASAFNQDLSNWKVGNVENMAAMFCKASSFNQDLSNWNVGNVENMAGMFCMASSFNQDLSNWKVGNVKDMSGMFCIASSFNQDLSNWNVGNVENMAGMFCMASSFNQDLSDWKVGNVKDMTDMFRKASAFNQDLSNWNVGNVEAMTKMFWGASSFNQDLSNWNVGNVEDMSGMFCMASSFNQDLSNWNVGNVKDMSGTFWGASAFNQDLSNWNVGNVKVMYSMFFIATAFNQDLSNWNVGNVKDMYNMFCGASAFNQDLSNWNVGNVENMSNMFCGASAFNQDLSRWNVGNVKDMTDMFCGASSFNQDLSNWNVGNVEDMSNMFCSASSFNQDLSRWNVGNVKDMSGMFCSASAFNQDLSNWNVGNVKDMTGMFCEASSFNQDLSHWNVGNVKVMTKMFQGA